MSTEKNYTINRKKFLEKSVAVAAGIGVTCWSHISLSEQVPAVDTKGYRTLGKTGIKVSVIGWGGSRINEPAPMKNAFDMGVNLIDTGRSYTGGKNEEMIGKTIEGIRQKIIIQTKFSTQIVNDRKKLDQSLSESLKALRTDYIDILMMHGASSVDQLFSDVVMEFLQSAKKSGKIRFYGFSSHKNHIELLKATTDRPFYDVCMVPYNHSGSYKHHYFKGVESEWDSEKQGKNISAAAAKGIGIIAMKTCSAGPYKGPGQSTASYANGLKWILKNQHISSMAVAMASFEQVEEDTSVLST